MNDKEVIITRNKRTPLETVVPLASPYVIFLDPSGRCNFKCNFCPCNVDGYMMEERHKIMEWELFKKIADDIAAFEEQVKVIYLNGFGEPLLNPNIVEMVKYLKSRNICREIRLTTNGALLNPELNSSLIDAGLDLLRISVEALDRGGYKKICGINFNFEELVENITDFYKKSRGKCKVAAKIVNASLKSEEDKDRFYEIFENITDFHYIEEIQEFWPEFEDIVIPSGSMSANKLYHDDMSETTVCAAPLTEMTIYANGNVGICAADWKFALVYGNAAESDIKELWKSEKLKKFQIEHLTKKRENIEFCSKCKYKSQDYIDNVTDIIVNRLRERI